MSNRFQSADRQPHYIRAWRRARGMTVKELADAIGVSPATVSRIERGIQPYTEDSLAALAGALGCTTTNLTTRSRFRVPARSLQIEARL